MLPTPLMQASSSSTSTCLRTTLWRGQTYVQITVSDDAYFLVPMVAYEMLMSSGVRRASCYAGDESGRTATAGRSAAQQPNISPDAGSGPLFTANSVLYVGFPAMQIMFGERWTMSGKKFPLSTTSQVGLVLSWTISAVFAPVLMSNSRSR